MCADDSQDVLPPNDYPLTTAYHGRSQQSMMKNWVVGTMHSNFDANQKLGTPELIGSQQLAFSLTFAIPKSIIVPLTLMLIRNAKTLIRALFDEFGRRHDLLHVHRGHGGRSPPPWLSRPGGWLMGSSYNNSPSAQLYLTYGKTSSFTRPGPSKTWVFMDENPKTINDGSMAISAVAAPGSTYLIDYPSGMHGGAGGISFADGHSIVHKWQDRPPTLHPMGSKRYGWKWRRKSTRSKSGRYRLFLFGTHHVRSTMIDS